MATLYPGALDTDTSLYVAVNGVSTKLSGDLDPVTTTVNVNATNGFPATGAITIKGEAIAYAAKTSTSFTGCTRGYDSTAKANHYRNDLVEASPIADHHNVLKGAIQALESKLGTGSFLPSSAVGPSTIPAAYITPAMTNNPYKVRVYHTGALAITSGTKITLTNLTGSDPQSMWDSVNNRVICKLAGRYLVTASVNFSLSLPQATAQTSIWIAKNGTEISRFQQLYSAVNGATPALVGADMIDLAVNDYIELWAAAVPNNQSLYTPSSGQFNYLAVALLP